MLPIKFAAIKLKGISRKDREWVLNKLSDQERKKLQEILLELDEISFSQIANLEAMLNENSSSIKDHYEASLDEGFIVGESNVYELIPKMSDYFLAKLIYSLNLDRSKISQILGAKRYKRILNIPNTGKSIPKSVAIGFLNRFKIEKG